MAGAFDRVSAEILIAKLEMYGLHPRIVAVLKSWLEKRTACVLVGGERSELFDILNQIFQGTVLGPILWDVFFADVSLPIRTTGFKEVMFADDLNSYREYGGNAKNSTIAKHAKNCQTEVHTWGKAMQVEFEATKESVSNISAHDPEGPDFKLMGLWFDTQLSMKHAITDLHNALRWKVTKLLRVHKSFDTIGTMVQFKARIAVLCGTSNVGNLPRRFNSAGSDRPSIRSISQRNRVE